MKPVLLTATIAALVTVAGCNRTEDASTASTNGTSNSAVPDTRPATW
jgi:nitrous oxide reductase accessory protein NosL